MKNLLCAITCGLALQCFSGYAAAGVRVQMKDNDGTTSAEWMRLELKVINDQPTPYDLTNTTLRYYFRDTSKTWTTAVWSFLVNSNACGTCTVTAGVAAEPLLQDGWVLTLTFSSGTINGNSDAWVLAGAHNENWTTNELDDYSYLTGTVFQDDNGVALYRADEHMFGPQVLAAPAGSGPNLTVTSNPIISYASRKHYSSDPAVTLVPSAGKGPLLYLATSTDLYSSTSCGSILWPPNWFKSCGIDYPMDGVHVYDTLGPGVANAPWFETGPVLADNSVGPTLVLQDFAVAGADVNSITMFAPDLQFVPAQSTMYMYVPMPGTDHKWHIGTASVFVNATGGFGHFVPSSQFMTLNPAPGGAFNPPAAPVDPGVFPAMDANGKDSGNYFMLYVDASAGQVNTTVGNFSMASLRSDMVTGDFKGKVGFAAPYTHHTKLTNYMEGPDVAVMTAPSGTPYYYMVFTANGDSSTPSSSIGYAMATKAAFDANPLTCWNFKGWIFEDFGTGNNHANLVQYNGKYYVFYHQGSTAHGNHQRQVWAKEITLVNNPTNNPFLPSDGEIVGVTRPTSASMEQLSLYGSLNGTTTGINRSTQYIRNAINNDVAWSYVTLSPADTFKEGEGIFNRYLNNGATNQEWIVEDVPAGTTIGSVVVPPNAVRLTNMLTPDKRMTCGAAYNSDTDGTNFGLFNNTLASTSVNQIWVKEQGADASSAIKLRSLWNNNSNTKFYLTRIQTGASDTYCKATVSTSPQRQEWFIE